MKNPKLEIPENVLHDVKQFLESPEMMENTMSVPIPNLEYCELCETEVPGEDGDVVMTHPGSHWEPPTYDFVCNACLEWEEEWEGELDDEWDD